MLALAYDAMLGPDAEDAACTTRPAEPVAGQIERGIDGIIPLAIHLVQQR